MKNILLTLGLIVIIPFDLSAQSKNKTIFIDSCSKAISYYEDFLINMPKGRYKFQRGNDLFKFSHKLLINLKDSNNIGIQERDFKSLSKAISICEGINYDEFVQQEKQSKDKVKIKVRDIYTYLSKENGASFLILIDIIKARLEDIN